MKTQTGLLFLILFLSATVSFAQGVDAGVEPDRTPTKTKTAKAKVNPSRPTKISKTKSDVSVQPQIRQKTAVSKTSLPKKTQPRTEPINKPKTTRQKTPAKTPASNSSAGLTVITNENDVRIFIDDVEVQTENEQSPFIFNNLRPGNYEIRIEKSGFETKRRQVRLIGGKIASVNFNLTATAGILDVSTNSSSAVIEIDNQVFRGEIQDLTLAEGSYPLKVSKKGFKTVSTIVTIENGRKTSRIIQLYPLGTDELLKESDIAFSNKEFAESLSICRQILKNDPNNVRALTLSGYSYHNLNRLQESFYYFSAAVSQGAEIELPVQFTGRKQNVNSMQHGEITINRRGIYLRSFSDTNENLRISSSEISELKYESNYISIKGIFVKDQRTIRTTYYLMQIPSTQALFQLLQQVKTGVSYREKGFGIVILPSENFQTIRKRDFQIAVPTNWLEIRSDENSGFFAPMGGFKENNKTVNYSHGVNFGLIKPASRNVNLEQLSDNVVNSLLSANPNYRKTSEFRYVTINGRKGMALSIEGFSTASQRDEIVSVYFTITKEGNFLYLYTVSPSDEAEDYTVTFESILNSIEY